MFLQQCKDLIIGLQIAPIKVGCCKWVDFEWWLLLLIMSIQ